MKLTHADRRFLRCERRRLSRLLKLMSRNAEHRRLFGCEQVGIVVGRNNVERPKRHHIMACLEVIEGMLW